MHRVQTDNRIGKGLALATGLLLWATICVADGLDSPFAAWLGREITIESSSANDQIPAGGKLTFVFDADDDVVRICTRSVPEQKGPWRMDLAQGCNVALRFTSGQRYCTIADVKAGNGEVLSQCHRLRSREVALKRSTASADAIELKDMIVFLISPERGKSAIAILLDSPSRVTSDGVYIGRL